MERKKQERVLFYMTLALIFVAYFVLFMGSTYLRIEKLSHLLIFVFTFEILFFVIYKKRMNIIKEMNIEYDKTEKSQEQKKLFLYSRIAMFSGFFTIPAYMRERSSIFMLLSAVFMVFAMILNDRAERSYPLLKKEKKGKKHREGRR